jgi:hypothetical protein
MSSRLQKKQPKKITQRQESVIRKIEDPSLDKGFHLPAAAWPHETGDSVLYLGIEDLRDGVQSCFLSLQAHHLYVTTQFQSVISWHHLRTTVFRRVLEAGKECCEKSGLGTFFFIWGIQTRVATLRLGYFLCWSPARESFSKLLVFWSIINLRHWVWHTRKIMNAGHTSDSELVGKPTLSHNSECANKYMM